MDDEAEKHLNGSPYQFEKLERGLDAKERTDLLIPFPVNKVVQTKDPSKSQKYRRCSHILAVISIIMCIVCIILTVLIFANSQKPSEIPDAQQEPFDMCVPCLGLVEDPANPYASDSLLDTLNEHLKGHTRMCCARSGDQLSALIEATMREQKTRPVPEPPSIEKDGAVLKFTPASAHKMLQEPEKISDEEGPSFNDSTHILARLNTKFHDPLTEHVRNVTVNETGLIIEYTGHYYVYASAHFYSNSTKFGHEIAQKWWRVYIHRTRLNSPAATGTLFKIDHTVAEESILQNTGHSGYSGGTFHLKKGDKLEACISGQGLIDFGKPSTFLGLYMLASDPKKN